MKFCTLNLQIWSFEVAFRKCKIHIWSFEIAFEMLLTHNNLVLVHSPLYVCFGLKCIFLTNCIINEILALVDNIW